MKLGGDDCSFIQLYHEFMILKFKKMYRLYDNEFYFLVLIYNIIECIYLYVKETGYQNTLNVNLK